MDMFDLAAAFAMTLDMESGALSTKVLALERGLDRWELGNH